VVRNISSFSPKQLKIAFIAASAPLKIPISSLPNFLESRYLSHKNFF